MALGPFDVDEGQITRLGTRFTPFVNALIQTEASRNRIGGSGITYTTVEHIPDEGVDFEVRDAPRTDWLPEGSSAWQFKRGDYEPAEAANEFEGATWAREIVSAGGSYVFVTGASLPPAAIGRRQKKIMAKAVELGLVTEEEPDRIRVYAANELARWASRFPSLAIGSLLDGPRVARDIEEWRESREHKGITWVADDQRMRQMAELRREVMSASIVTVRIEGPSGIGKSRMVMEALDTDECRRLVAYVPDERATIDGLIDHLHDGQREAIVVVDECRGEQHLKLVEKFRSDPAIRLVTIGQGEATPTATRTPILRVARMDDVTVETFLKENFKTFGAEQRRFVVTNCDGNVRWAGAMAAKLLEIPAPQASEIIERNDIERFVAEWLPEGRDFLYAASLALFERVGWDGDLRQQLRVVAGFAGCTDQDLDAVGIQLEQQGLLVRQGRYRAVTPQPFAIYMATEGWRIYGDRIWSELLPDLDDESMLSLLRRTADLGQFEPAQRALFGLLSADGPFGSIDAIEATNSGRLLTQLAIVMPEEVMQHLGGLVTQETIEDLRGFRSARRDLVWTLEKLVWHTRTFERAADALLRLAVAENETYANNATGTWIDLFGTFLPGTAASPKQRYAYLASHAQDLENPVRLLVAQAAGKALTTALHESIAVSGELQGGALVEPRGGPKTWGEAAEYRKSLIDLLVALSSDSDHETAEASSKALIGSLHALLEDGLVGEYLSDAVLLLGEFDQQAELRKSVDHLQGIYRRHDPGGRELFKERMAALAARLPALQPGADLNYLLRLNRWELGDEDELASRMQTVVDAVVERAAEVELWNALMTTDPLPGAWELGLALASHSTREEDYLAKLTERFRTTPNALLGYLVGLQRSGRESAFDDFLGSPLAASLSDEEKLSLATRGPATESARRLILGQARILPVVTAAQMLFGWQRNVSPAEVRGLVVGWLDKAVTGDDYQAMIGWLSMWLHSRDTTVEGLGDLLHQVVMRRRDFPDLSGHDEWQWTQLAKGSIAEHSGEVLNMTFDLIESRQLMVVGMSRGFNVTDTSGQLVLELVRANPAAAWAQYVQRVEGGSWILPMQLRGWFTREIPPEVITEWVGASLERAQLAASVISVGDERPSAVAQALLERFPDDDEIGASLYGEFSSGVWTGPESARLSEQIEQLQGWSDDSIVGSGMRAWASKIAAHLRDQRTQALEREAERGY